MTFLTRKGFLIEEQGMSYLADSDPDLALGPLRAAACTYRIALGPRALPVALPREFGVRVKTHGRDEGVLQYCKLAPNNRWRGTPLTRRPSSGAFMLQEGLHCTALPEMRFRLALAVFFLATFTPGYGAEPGSEHLISIGK